MVTEQLLSPIKLDLRTFHRLRDYIYEQCGIFFTESKLPLLERRLFVRLRELGMANFTEYTNYLAQNSGGRKELVKMFDLITVNETYFFRYEQQLQVFAKDLLPEFLTRNPSPKGKIYIWSAGCSSGEEVYTIAIILRNLFDSDVLKNRFSILGTDISERILNKAQRGIYGRNSFRQNIPRYFRRKFFVANGNYWEVNPELKSVVRFKNMNLNDLGQFEDLQGVHFIFCRNVLIYFDEMMKKRVVNKFYDVLTAGGYLFLGEAESLYGINSAFQVVHYPQAFVYKKMD